MTIKSNDIVSPEYRTHLNEIMKRSLTEGYNTKDPAWLNCEKTYSQYAKQVEKMDSKIPALNLDINRARKMNQKEKVQKKLEDIRDAQRWKATCKKCMGKLSPQ